MHNIGTVDRTIRIVAGVAILSLIFIVEGNARWFGLLGLLPLATVFVRWCPAYSLFGISSADSK